MSGLLRGTAFVTGAGSGIGRATAICLAQHGVSNLALGDVDTKRLEETQAELAAQGLAVQVILIELDVSSEDAVREAIEKTVAAFGRIDYAVNNAGVAGPMGRAENVAFAEWRRLLDVNLNGVWLCQRAEIQQMLKQDLRATGPYSPGSRGVIVNVASILGLMGASGTSPVTAYSAAKHAVMGLTKTDARVYAREGIRINAICPGFIETPLLTPTLNDAVRKELLRRIPADRLGAPEEIGNSIVYLMSHLSSFMYGHGLVVDG
ncbi:3-oxoacyl-[acyl-carrier-protein] reductase FabG [Fonsecaea pedrosoi]|nr:3-oxoacyl-[acyl-carrier-protein] reductase FabG [Fonsecaea pedrosoi]